MTPLKNSIFGKQRLRALWLNNPYAHLMLHGKIETRNRPTNVRGPVLICSCKKEYTAMHVLLISGGAQLTRIEETLADLGQPWNGWAICIGNLVDCRPMTPEDENACFVQYREGLWCWIFEDVRPVKYFEIKGKQGWSYPTIEQQNEIFILD